MSDCDPARNPSLPEAIRRILLVLLAAVWWFRFEQPAGAALLSSPLVDAGLIGMLAFWGHGRGLAWQDGLLWLILSRRLHLDAYEGLEALQPLVQVAWLALGAAWASVTTERGRFLLVVYHAGLTFDAGMARSFGLGMSVGWEAAPLTLLFLAAALRRVFLSGGETRFPAGAVPVFLGMLALVAVHRLGPAGHLTCAVTATVAAAMLFLATTPRDGTDGAEALAVLALGGIPLCLAALQLGIADAPDIAVFLRKRLSAGGLHPNLIAAWSLVMLFAVGFRSSWGFLPEQARRVARFAVTLVYAVMLFGAGSRVVLIVGLLVGGIALIAHQRTVGAPRWLLMLAAGAATLMTGWRLAQSAFVGEWLLNERLFIWAAALKSSAIAPWTGHGILSYGELPQVIDPDAGIWVYDWIYPHTHQVVLELLVWGGVPLLAGAGIAWILFWRKRRPGIWRYAALSMSFIGLADVVHYTPAMLFLVLLVWFRPSGPVTAPSDDSPARGGLWTYPVLVLGGIALLAVANGEESRMRYREALDGLARGDGAWHARLDEAVSAAPLRLDLRLQRLLMELSFGAEPDEEQLLRVKSWCASRPNYYLIHYIESRIHELGGNDRGALDASLRSLELEPRDPMGIRWGRAAIIARRLGQEAGTYAWRAIQRGIWGAACVLDHPVYGAAFRREMAERLTGFRVGSAQELMQAHQASVALVDRGAASLTLPVLAGPAGMVPEWLMDGCGSVELKLASNTAGAASVVASAAADLDKFLVARLRALCAMADAMGASEIVGRAAVRLRSVWSYRNKNDEDPWLLWWLARSALVRNDPAEALGLLDRLDAMDPANPWILERRGEALQRLGDARGAREAFEAALRVVPIARLDPLFAAGPRELYAPAGDQWSFALERAFRRFDQEADAYHAEEWTRLREGLEQRLGTPRSGQGTSNTSPNRSE